MERPQHPAPPHLARTYLAQLPHFLEHHQHKPIHPAHPQLTLDVDASHTASGGVLYTVTDTSISHHYWSIHEAHHINVLELLSALLSIKAFTKHLHNHTVLLRHYTHFPNTRL